jgi:hypothetical protein
MSSVRLLEDGAIVVTKDNVAVVVAVKDGEPSHVVWIGREAAEDIGAGDFRARAINSVADGIKRSIAQSAETLGTVQKL